MNPRLLQVYHRMPAPLRSASATLRGLYLRSWRYSAATAEIARAATARERWSRQQWDEFQKRRLAAILERAATRVPYYRELWQRRAQEGDRRSPLCLEHWPILEKTTLRAHAASFVADDCDRRRMYHEQTSGTTGTPLELWRSLATNRAWYGLFEARWRGWYGVSANDRWAILGGQLVAPIAQERPPFWVWNAALNQLYMSSYHLKPAFVPSYVDALRDYRIRYIWGYTSALHALAEEILRLGLEPPRLTVAIANAEPVFDYQREAVARAFGCPLRETYGMAEKVAAAGECEAGRLHLWPEVGIVEVVNGDRPAPAGTIGELVATSLLDGDMPLIRYRIGDRGALDPDGQCVCGRTLPLLAALEGRSDDLLVTADGRRVGRLDPVFKTELPIREAQMIQEALDHIHVRYVPDSGCSPAAATTIADRVRERFGPVRVTTEAVDSIPRGSNGKFRAVITRLSAEQIRHATSARQ